LPDISGVDVCRMLTERYRIPIIMLTARGTVEDKLYGLESGADDYIT
ncbi:MAG TPA: DNA-binding response regulator, partial [Lachnospiraceae bacterium]|nr:DNA-binding response regulator [Lachnospiraceae bacterium]